ncbi:glycosyltransferase family 2 protein [Yersinia vastinensis]|uniref:glycosyltransferase family 2 protein n=1 Tax=Yersinia vastinensis TaxID=2890318 RepID=UPI001643F42D|nr:glycosyltransferase family 2 protein [Yersinia vastinensis]
MNDLTLSVVITTYNRPELVVRAVNSVVSQRSQKYRIEIIVVDDASTSLLPEFNVPELITYRMPINGGPGLARMQGLKLSHAPWVLILDDDDVMTSGSVEKLMHILDDENLDSYLVTMFACSNGSMRDKYHLISFDDYMSGYIIGDFTPVFNREKFLATGLSYPQTRLGGEHLLWWRIALDYKGIPTFNMKLIDVSNDAPSRLTSATTQVKYSAEHKILADLTLSQFGERISKDYPEQFRRISLARITYSLLSNDKASARRYILTSTISLSMKMSLLVISLCPQSIIRKAFVFYRGR